MAKQVLAGSISFFLAAISGCTNVGAPTLPDNPFAVKVPFVIPAKNPEAATIHSIVVVPLGDKSEVVTQNVEAALTQLRSEDSPFYSKVSHGSLPPQTPADAILASLGHQEGVAGVLTVSMTAAEVEPRSYQESRSQCATTSSKTFSTCPKGQTRTSQVACQGRTMRMTVAVRMFDVVSRRVVYSEIVGDSADTSACTGDATGLISDPVLTGQTIDKITNRIVSAIAPTVELRPLDLMEPDPAVPAASQDSFSGALKFARAKRMDEACTRFDDLYDGNKDSIALTYNKAFCDESRGEIFKADTEYRHASALANQPNSKIDKHLLHVEDALKEGAYIAKSNNDTSPVSSSPSKTSGTLPSSDELSKQRRVALVIGNSHYASRALRTPVKDAQAMQVSLRKLGFDVTEVEDVNSGRFKGAIKDFVNRAKNADVALFYYSGHGFQTEDKENWLMPVDNESVQYVEDAVGDPEAGSGPWAVQVHYLLAQLDGKTNNIKILILDSCRDSPLQSKKSSSTGMADIKVLPRGSIVAFATSPGMTAAEGKGELSVFTTQLVKNIQTPNLTIDDVLKRVRRAVSEETQKSGHSQMPSEEETLTGDFYFKVSSK